MPPRNLTNSFPSWNNNSQSSLYDDINDDPDKSSSNSDPSTDKLSQTNSDSHLVSSSDNNSANNNNNHNNHNNNNNTTPNSNLNSNRDFINQTRDYLPHSDDFLKDPSNNLQSYSNKFTFAPLNNANDTSNNNNNNVNNIALSPPSIQFSSRYNMTPSPSTNSVSPMTNDKLKYKSSTPDDLNRYPQSLSSSRFNSLTNIKDYYNQQQQPLLLQPQQLNRTSGSVLSKLNPFASNNNSDSSINNSKISLQNNEKFADITDSPGLDSAFGSGSSGSNEKSGYYDLMQTEYSPFGGYPPTAFPLHIDEKEPDDELHNPDPIKDAEYEKNRMLADLKTMDKRSIGGLIGMIFFVLGAAAIFIVLPAVAFTHGGEDSSFTSNQSASGSGSNTTGVQGSNRYEVLTNYIYPQLSAIRTNLVDSDTPQSAYTRTAKDGSDWKLVFSDEFNAEGRTFYEGDDQFWYGADFHYDATKDLEWYDPDALTTDTGTLQIRMDAFKNHNLYYRSGMLHSWNRMCFTQGVMEVSARLPNYGNIKGLWPGIWSMGNIGRPGFMATTDGVWPYSYSTCDAGITPNQSSSDGISYLPGQRLNSCTCQGEDHPNRGTGRGAPEIDILEGDVDTNIQNGVASQSLQVAPMDIWYIPDYNFIEIHNKSITGTNPYAGGPFQQALSVVTTLNPEWFEKQIDNTNGSYQNYAYEYLNNDENGYIRWFVGDDPSFTVHQNAFAPNGNIDWRLISKEPMSMILNLGVSNNWAYIDWPSIDFPISMSIDYIRVYQPEDEINLTCDPKDYPTFDYINNHPAAYRDWNVTHWENAGYSTPKHRLNSDCS